MAESWYAIPRDYKIRSLAAGAGYVIAVQLGVMESNPTLIVNYFSGFKQNLVPLFQRPYTWADKQWRTLWEDILTFYDYDEADTKASQFLGAVVTMPARSVPVGVSKFLVIDGQQRLTTVALIMCAIRDALPPADQVRKRRIQNFYLTNEGYEGLDFFKLLPTQGDRASYSPIVQNSGGALRDSQFKKAYEFFRRKLRDQIEDGMNIDAAKILHIIESRLLVVMINLSDSDDPYLIFESLNFKGSPLEQADLVRNYFLMRFSVNEQPGVYENLWLPMQNRLGPILTEFMRHFLGAEGEEVRKGDVYAAIRRLVANSDAPSLKILMTRMEQLAVLYSRLATSARGADLYRGSAAARTRAGGLRTSSRAARFIVVIGIALLLNYAYTHIGPLGRVALSYAGAFAMLIAGVMVERRPTYRTFAYGLIGGGWAAVYLTTFAMHAITAAKILDNAWVAAALLLAVAIGMIVHSLRYQSQTVTGLAYFIAFVTLAISEVTTFSVIALVPLAASLLYVAHRYEWSRFALFGLIATYLTVGMHKDTGAPLWEAQTIFLIYWLLFEAFDLIRADRWLLPLNALGFLMLSGVKWSHAAPDSMWIFAAGTSALYLGSTIGRAQSGRWRPAVALNAALAMAAILLKLEHQWVAVALLIVGEIYYLAGIRFRSAYLRWIAAAMFAVELLHLGIVGGLDLPPRSWEPVAAATALVFYLNRALRPLDVFYGYCAAVLAAVVSGFEASEHWRGRVWTLMAAVPFGFGWWRRQFDFRVQGYGLGAIGAVATALYTPHPPMALAIGAALAYGFVQCALRSGEGRFLELKRDAVRWAGSAGTTMALTALIWRVVPGEWLGAAWLALAVVLLEAGLRDLPRELRWQAYLVALLGLCRAFTFDLSSNFTLLEAALLYAFAIRARDEEEGRVFDVATSVAAVLLMFGLSNALPVVVVSATWAILALALGEFERRSMRVQSMAVAAAVFVRCVSIDLYAAHSVLAIAPAIVCFWAAMLRKPRGSRTRMYFSLLAASLLATLIFREVSGSVLTIAWAVEGVALLAAGFPLRDRVLRLSGLALLAVCTGKLFFWDLRNLDTLPRIVSFIVLGLLLVAVSWIYTRFRDQVQRIL